MDSKGMKKEQKKSLLPKVAKLLGDKTLDSACALWYYQPKVPAAMRKDAK